MLISHLCDFNDAYIVVKRTITVSSRNNAKKKKKKKKWHLKIMHHLLIASQKLMV